MNATTPTLISLALEGDRLRRSMDRTLERQQKLEDARLAEYWRKHRKLVREAIVESEALAINEVLEYDKAIKRANRAGWSEYGVPFLVEGGSDYHSFLSRYLPELHIEKNPYASTGWFINWMTQSAEVHRPELRHLKRGLFPRNCQQDFSSKEDAGYSWYVQELVGCRVAMIYTERGFNVFIKATSLGDKPSYNIVITWEKYKSWWRYPCPSPYMKDPRCT